MQVLAGQSQREVVRSRHRTVAAMTVGKLRMLALTDRVRPLLNDPSPQVRQLAATGLSLTASDDDFWK